MPPLRRKLAFIGGFVKPPESLAQGTFHAAYLLCHALAQQNQHTAFDLYQEKRSGFPGELSLPRTPPTRVFDKLSLRTTGERYQAIYVANGEQMTCAPHVLRPAGDAAPVICSIGTAHSTSQWMSLLMGLLSGELSPSDGFIFKSRAAEALFRSVWTDWSRRFGVAPIPQQTRVIPNGVDVERNLRSETARQRMRRQLRIADDEVAYLAYSRLSPGTKGDQQALVVRWKDVIRRVPRAVLLLTGAVVERPFVAELRNLARAAGVSDRVLVLDNPFEIAADARTQLMSAADVFIHMSTGIEETSSLVVHEAMAHSLPVITTAWAGMPDIIEHGANGFLIPTTHAPAATHLSSTLFGQSDTAHALATSRLVMCDWTAFLNAVESSAQPQIRAKMSKEARSRAEARNLSVIAHEHCEFFEETSGAAESRAATTATGTPLVDLNVVLAAQASRALVPSVVVRLADRARGHLLSEGLLEESAERVACVLAAFDGATHRTLAELSRTLSQAAAQSCEGQPDAGSLTQPIGGFEDNARLLVRMLNFGLLEPV